MKVLLTGCAGFVGWKTGECLLREGHTVTGLDNLNDYYPRALKEWRLGQLHSAPGGSFRFIEGDILDEALTDRIFDEGGFDAVINLAARAGVRASLSHPRLYMATNITGVVNLLVAMARTGVKKFVQASSSSLYAGQPAPFSEDQRVDCPLSPYAASKKASEVMAYTYHHLHGIDVSVLRFFTVYGPAGRPDMTPLKFTHCIARGRPFPLYGDGEQQRDFTYIDDIARGVVASLKPVGYEIINLGAGKAPVSINHMIALLEQYLGKKARIEHQPFNPADMRDTSADNSKAARLLGWKPEMDPEAGFKTLVEWYQQEEPWLAPELDLYKG